ncbi:hypothetical protein ACOMHN_066087 [Nucella lapillus]
MWHDHDNSTHHRGNRRAEGKCHHQKTVWRGLEQTTHQTGPDREGTERGGYSMVERGGYSMVERGGYSMVDREGTGSEETERGGYSMVERGGYSMVDRVDSAFSSRSISALS